MNGWMVDGWMDDEWIVCYLNFTLMLLLFRAQLAVM